MAAPVRAHFVARPAQFETAAIAYGLARVVQLPLEEQET
jgi:hypothetical protein